MKGVQADKSQRRSRGHDRIGDHANPGSGLDVIEDRADQAGRVRQSGRKTSLTAPGKHSVMQAHAFTPSEDNERLAPQSNPRHRSPQSEWMSGQDSYAQRLF